MMVSKARGIRFQGLIEREEKRMPPHPRTRRKVYPNYSDWLRLTLANGGYKSRHPGTWLGADSKYSPVVRLFLLVNNQRS